MFDDFNLIFLNKREFNYEYICSIDSIMLFDGWV